MSYYDEKQFKNVPDDLRTKLFAFLDAAEEAIFEIADRAAMTAMPWFTTYGLDMTHEKAEAFITSKLIPLAVLCYLINKGTFGRSNGNHFQVIVVGVEEGMEINVSLQMNSATTYDIDDEEEGDDEDDQIEGDSDDPAPGSQTLSLPDLSKFFGE
jgi:hypothetical protein